MRFAPSLHTPLAEVDLLLEPLLPAEAPPAPDDVDWLAHARAAVRHDQASAPEVDAAGED